MTRPERFVVGHPFNPVYLLPLVEVVGGERTSEESDHARLRLLRRRSGCGRCAFAARSTASSPTGCSRRSGARRSGSCTTGVATVEEIDDAIRFGPGLRWAQMGTFLTYRIAGGEGGMRQFMAQFGPALAWPWTKLMDVPELTDELLDTIAAQSDEQAGGLSVGELERVRDDNLVAILHALRQQGYGAGAVLADHERLLLRRRRGRPRRDGRPTRTHPGAPRRGRPRRSGWTTTAT